MADRRLLALLPLRRLRCGPIIARAGTRDARRRTACEADACGLTRTRTGWRRVLGRTLRATDSRRWRTLLLASCVAALTACATRPPASDFPRTASFAIAPGTPTQLGDALAARERAHPGEDGFKLLSTGRAALEARLALANAAQRTLDMQYYIAAEDDTGKLILDAALRAADRGVRVRFLVDDLNFKDLGDVMATLNAHPDIEIRIFNPFATANQGPLARITNAMTHLDSLTRRMHNKALIVDNQVAIVGGRNLGDEYFDASPTLVFRDLDLLVAGPLVSQVSASFDEFWNSEQAYPLRALNTHRIEPADVERVRKDLDAHWQQEFADAAGKPLYQAPLSGIAHARGDRPDVGARRVASRHARENRPPPTPTMKARPRTGSVNWCAARPRAST
ncbi:MAG: phospholipase D-like domain-containing protein [Pararobbsia sp.]